ncbi:uncharacterized protein LOC144630868 [Oculina patagonica]
MNFSQSSSIASESECKSFFYDTVPLRYSAADSFDDLLVAAAVLCLAACPFTILLNALVMVAVKTTRRLQTHPNILLACLALTDLMVGLVVQPLHISKTILLLQGKDFYEFCDIDLAFTISFVMSCFASLFHLVLISGELFLAIKHTFTHANFVTKARLIVSSAVAWIAAVFFLLAASYSRVMAFIFIVATFTSIVLLQILVYKEARRHEIQILSQQASLEARAKFKQQKKALKLTTIILVTIFLCFFFPLIIIFVTWHILNESISHDAKTLVRHFSFTPVIINSVLNPVIYTVRKREFRVGFIELLLRKSFQEAGEFERRLFGSTDNAVRRQNGQGEGERQNAEERNEAHANDKQEDNPEVLASGANVDDHTTFATQIEPVSSNALNSISKTTEEEHGEERNPAGAKVDDNILATQNEPIPSNALNSTSKKTEEEHGEGRNAAHANDKQEDNPEILATGANVGDNTTLATQNKPVSSNALNSISKKTEEGHGEERNTAHSNDKQEDNPEVLASGANVDDHTTLATQIEPISSNALNSISKTTEEEDGEERNPAHAKDKQQNNAEVTGTAQNENLSSNEHNASKTTEKEPQHQLGLEKVELGIETVNENIAKNSRTKKLGHGRKIEIQPEFEVTSL